MKPFLISVRNVIDLSKLPEISYVNNEGGQEDSEMNVGVRCRARVLGELLTPLPPNNNVNSEHL